jgi:hypothetical protein
MPMEESARRVETAGSLGRFLHGIRKRYDFAQRADKGMFDLGDIAALIDPERTSQWEITEAPAVRFDYSYDFARKNGSVLRIHSIDRYASFELLDCALERIAKSAAPN